MKAVIAIDSFKGSLSSLESGRAVKAALERVYPGCECAICPLADGGEGTVSAIISSVGGKIVKVCVTGPLGEPTEAEYGVLPDGRAVIEIASAAGLTKLPVEERNPLHTTTYGVGELIASAINNGCRSFIIGLGGSATNDGGVGMLSALGFGFLNGRDEPVSRGALGLSELHRITTEGAIPELSECEFRIASDVSAPLCGENGASFVFAPQKGASPESVADMDGWLSDYSRLTARTVGTDFSDYHGAGAAGGLGFAFLSYLGAHLESGIGIVMDVCGIPELIKKSDLVITGEGRLDGQSCMGKAPVGIAAIAKKYSKPTVAFSGCVSEGAEKCNELGIDAFFPIVRSPITLDEAMKPAVAYSNLEATAEQVFRLMKASGFLTDTI
ncbi:MAG: glycerate kinase [Clostridia bacterium]|nr:glycerate kinase [Clostridia bacterium]